MTFTWCSSYCRVVGNEMADEQAKKRAASNEEDVLHHYDSVKATIMCATRGGNLPLKNLTGVWRERRRA